MDVRFLACTDQLIYDMPLYFYRQEKKENDKKSEKKNEKKKNDSKKDDTNVKDKTM